MPVGKAGTLAYVQRKVKNTPTFDTDCRVRTELFAAVSELTKGERKAKASSILIMKKHFAKKVGKTGRSIIAKQSSLNEHLGATEWIDERLELLTLLETVHAIDTKAIGAALDANLV